MTCKVVTPDVDDFVKRSLIAQLDCDRREAGRYSLSMFSINNYLWITSDSNTRAVFQYYLVQL